MGKVRGGSAKDNSAILGNAQKMSATYSIHDENRTDIDTNFFFLVFYTNFNCK